MSGRNHKPVCPSLTNLRDLNKLLDDVKFNEELKELWFHGSCDLHYFMSSNTD